MCYEVKEVDSYYQINPDAEESVEAKHVSFSFVDKINMALVVRICNGNPKIRRRKLGIT